MFKNPEFNRYITYKSSPGFWLWPPAMILFVTWILLSAFQIQHHGVATILVYCYCFTIFIYGLVNAGTVFSGEFKNKTWDFQRLSPMRPISLVVGKLFGSTAYSWYIGGLFLLVSYLTIMQSGNEILMNGYFKTLVLWVSIGLFSHILAFWASAGAGSSGFEAGLVAAVLLLMMLWDLIELGGGGAQMHWYGFEIDDWSFVSCSLIFYGFWLFRASVATTWEKMQYERGYPIDWFLFLLSVGLYLAGFSYKEPDEALLIFSVVMMITLYFGLFFCSGDWDKYRVVAKGLRNKSLSTVLKHVPRWTSALVLLIFSIVFALFYLGGMEGYLHATIMSSVTLFILRDGIVFHIIFMKKMMKRGVLLLILYYLFAYKLLPDLLALDFSGWADNAGEDANMQGVYLYNLFYPNVSRSPWLLASLPVFIECALGLWLLKIRLKKIDEMDIENEKRERLSG